jgi:chaperone modulatory protein CbpM
MNQTKIEFFQGLVVEEEILMNLSELCRACNAEEMHVMAWVFEGVLTPMGESPTDWQFGGDSLRRAKLAVRLSQDLDINPPGVALALDLLDEIALLRTQVR